MASVLAVGAHPDDVEAGCFGTLLRHKSCGDRVFVVVTTRGGDSARNWETIEGEFKKAQSLLGQSYTILDNPNGHYSMTWKTVGELDAIVRQHEIADSADEFIDILHHRVFNNHLVVFGNGGQIIRLQEKATVRDYLTKTNIEVSDGAVVKVNGTTSDMDQPLRDGDSVEISPGG